jgi:hypothetical protein
MPAARQDCDSLHDEDLFHEQNVTLSHDHWLNLRLVRLQGPLLVGQLIPWE